MSINCMVKYYINFLSFTGKNTDILNEQWMNKSKKKLSIIFHIFSMNLPHPCFGVSLAANIPPKEFTEQQVYGF